MEYQTATMFYMMKPSVPETAVMYVLKCGIPEETLVYAMEHGVLQASVLYTKEHSISQSAPPTPSLYYCNFACETLMLCCFYC
jgi:hypothetical protein